MNKFRAWIARTFGEPPKVDRRITKNGKRVLVVRKDDSVRLPRVLRVKAPS